MKQLRPYQLEMIDFMVDHPRCNLFAGMGLGKTVVTERYSKAGLQELIDAVQMLLQVENVTMLRVVG